METLGSSKFVEKKNIHFTRFWARRFFSVAVDCGCCIFELLGMDANMSPTTN